MSTILSLRKNEKTSIVTAYDALRKDVLRWVGVVAGFTLLQLGIFATIGGVNPNINAVQAGAFVAPQLGYALIFLACVAARKTIDVWTFVLGVVLIAGWLNGVGDSFTRAVFPNSILPALVAMVGFLAAGRLVMYLRAKYILELQHIAFARGTIITYACIIIATFALNSGFIYRLISNFII